jgi:hypothetical protein
MSYDISLVVDTGAPQSEWPVVIEIGACTPEISGTCARAFEGFLLNNLHGMPAWRAAHRLVPALHHMRCNSDEYLAADLPHGRDAYEHSLVYLAKLTQACVEHPKCQIRVSS